LRNSVVFIPGLKLPSQLERHSPYTLKWFTRMEDEMSPDGTYRNINKRKDILPEEVNTDD